MKTIKPTFRTIFTILIESLIIQFSELFVKNKENATNDYQLMNQLLNCVQIYNNK
jgi:hypothetical protein